MQHFLGRTVLRSRLSGKTFSRNLAPCEAVTHPAQFSGLGVLAILTIDLDRGMYSLDRDGVMAGAQVVYGSAGSLYVASRRYVRALELGADVPEGMRTEIHRFDITDPTKTVYRAQRHGARLHPQQLRALRARRPSARGHHRGAAVVRRRHVDARARARSPCSTQQRRGLIRVGSVTGLGKSERIYAVRFMGDRGYVVTFRQIDPLYTLDLSDPTAPKVVGELKIPGYSAYLHPVGETGCWASGARDRTCRRRCSTWAIPRPRSGWAQFNFGPGATPVEFEPHAFLYWAPANLAVMPLSTYDARGDTFMGAAGLRIAPDSLSLAGRVAHTNAERGQVPIERSFVIGDRLYTLSYLGILSSGLADLGALRYTGF